MGVLVRTFSKALARHGQTYRIGAGSLSERYVFLRIYLAEADG
jgi:hypothetical protein